MWEHGLGQREMGELMWGEEGQRWGWGKVMWGRGGDVGQHQTSGQAEAAPVLSSPYKGNVVALALPVPPSPPRLTHGWREGPAVAPRRELGYQGMGQGADGVLLPRPPCPA